MLSEPHLVTPEGKTIVLSLEEYRRVAKMLAVETRVERPSLTEALALAAEFSGKYATEPSLTRALIAEHQEERERDESRLRKIGQRG